MACMIRRWNFPFPSSNLAVVFASLADDQRNVVVATAIFHSDVWPLNTVGVVLVDLQSTNAAPRRSQSRKLKTSRVTKMSSSIFRRVSPTISTHPRLHPHRTHPVILTLFHHLQAQALLRHLAGEFYFLRHHVIETVSFCAGETTKSDSGAVPPI